MVNYSLEIVSHHEKFSGKTFLQYHVDQINTIGVWGDEPFEIRFKNHTSKKVQVKISIDGTDILTGKLADTEVSKDMWVVASYGTLNIKAWPETTNGGARLVFTSGNNSVALHTHGDTSNRGIIAAAVFIEGQPVQKIDYHHHYHSYPWYDWKIGGDFTTVGGVYGKGTGGNLGSGGILRSQNVGGMSSSNSSAIDASINNTVCSNYENVIEETTLGELQSVAAVGAGEHVEQKISYVQGLVKPLFTETVRVRYMWWDDLKTKLESAHSLATSHASGFPGNKEQSLMSLGSTPRVVTHSSFKKEELTKKIEHQRLV